MCVRSLVPLSSVVVLWTRIVTQRATLLVVTENYIERVFVSVLLLVASITHATVFGNVAVQIQQFDKLLDRYSDKVRRVHAARVSPLQSLS